MQVNGHKVKGIFILLIGVLALTAVGRAQDTSTDTTTFQLTNPLETVPQQYEILGVEVTGAKTVREDFIPSTAGLTVGSKITIPGDDITEAIKRLYRSGLFSDIKIIQTKKTLDGVYLEIQVKEQPRLETYKLEGIKRSQRNDLKERLSLLSGFAVKDASKAQAVNTIKRFYSEKGYWNTKVNIETTDTDTLRNRVTLIFHIDPGKRLEIKDISFKGNEHFDNKTLRKSLDKIKEDKWWKFFTKHVFKQKDYDEAKDNLLSFYREHGFRDVRIADDSVYVYNYKDDKKGIRVTIDVNEGPQYHVRNITWDGNTVYTDEQLSQSLGFQKGDVFDEKKFQQNIQFTKDNSDITSLYQNRGYLFFNIQPNIKVVRGDSLDIHFEITENEIATIQQVTFSGNTKTHDDVVRRTLRTIPGQKYSRSAIIRTVRELGQLGYFKQDKINPQPHPNYDDRTVDISYSLDESNSTDNFEFSGGFGGRNIGLILSARVNFNNFSIQNIFDRSAWHPLPSGDGQKLSLGVQVTGRGYQSYSFGFQEPWLMGKPTSFGVNLSYDILNYRGSPQKNELFSGSISLGKRLKWPDDYFQLQTVLNYQLYNVAGTSYLATGTSNIMSVKEILQRNSTDNPISPTQGSKFQVSAEVAPPLPNFSQFYKIKSQYQHHTPLFGDLVFTNSAEYGYIGYLGSNRKSKFQRFYLGGTPLQQRQSFINDNIDLRGFPGGSGGVISPVVDGQQVGGRLYSKYSLEMRYPAVNSDQVRLIPYVFFDAGNSYLDFADFSPFDVKRSTGVGARIFMPILGLVDLSYGYRLDGLDLPGSSVNAGQWEFLFNIGSPF